MRPATTPATAHEAFVVIDEQPKVKLRSVQVRGGETLQALLQRGAGNVERVDRVRLAALAGTLTPLGGQVGRDPQHPLAALDEKPLQGAGIRAGSPRGLMWVHRPS
jgi:hypothetical protein